MRAKYRSIAGSLILTAAAGGAAADASFVMSQGGVDATYQVKDGMVRMESQGPQGLPLVSLFDSRTQQVTQIYDQQRTYSVMDRAGIEAQQRQMRARMQQMLPDMERSLRERAAQMSPDQQRQMREYLERMRRSVSGEAAAPRFASRATGQRERVAGVGCQHYELSADGRPVSQACVAAAADLKISQADAETVMAMFRFMQSMAAAAGGTASTPPPDMPGLPVKVVGGDGRVMSELKSVSAAALDQRLFAIPQGYHRIDPGQPPPRQ